MAGEPDDAPTESPTVGRWGRPLLRPILAVVGLGIAIHVVYPQLGQLNRGLDALAAGRWPWLVGALVGSALVFLASAWTVRATVEGSSVRWRELVPVQVAAGFISSITPLAVGGAVTNQSYLTRRGVPASTATAAVGLNVAATFLSHAILLAVLVPFAAAALPTRIALPPHQVVLEVAIGVFVVGAVVFWLPRSRRAVVRAVLPVARAFKELAANPRRGIEVSVSVAAMNVAFGLTLWASAAAFGQHPGFTAVLAVYLVAAVVGAVSPTPGGLGPMEAALIAGLGRVGVPAGESVAIALTFRVMTYWIPLPIGAMTLGWLKRRDMV